MPLDNHVNSILKLRRAHQFGGAPHKPVLVLAILDLIQNGKITSLKVTVSGELILAFKAIWTTLVTTLHSSNFALPFYHLKSEPFWTLVSRAGKTIPLTSSHSIKSLAGLKDSVAYALLDLDFFSFCQHAVSREVLRQTLLNAYFPHTKDLYKTGLYQDLFHQYENLVIENPVASYVAHQRLDDLLNPEDLEEEQTIRGSLFKRLVPAKYAYRCAITRMQVTSTSSAVQLVDACHIIPISKAGIDHITNGISLSPTVHRAFDRGLITITPDYRVKVSPHLQEAAGPYALRQLENHSIALPEQLKYHPDRDFLAWHGQNPYLA